MLDLKKVQYNQSVTDVPDAELEYSRVPTKCYRLYTVPDAVLEERTVPPKCNRLYEVPDAGLGRKPSTTKVRQTAYST